jgi:hypothetical protein
MSQNNQLNGSERKEEAGMDGRFLVPAGVNYWTGSDLIGLWRSIKWHISSMRSRPCPTLFEARRKKGTGLVQVH